MNKKKQPASSAVNPPKPVKLVRMKRDAEYPPPHTADVHPDEVENYRQGGWQECDR